ncbi:MAG TPA: HAD family hydrolase [Pseudomonas sp.]|uniref:HAD family hydrolase n=1 Tax=Pseudomonas sp. TaxID=306 RepID=UPI002C0433DF|nr:HAD family hydrolase [Pseudomonas sp.]HTO19770.1 HAD family hydrolase [Pseudomonas sp.]
MALAIFDLDETLIAGNSPSLWGRYLGAQGWLDLEQFVPREQAMVRLYAERQLTLEDYLAFTLQPLAGRTPAECRALADRFSAEVIAPLFYTQALQCLERHRAAGDAILVISATQRFLVESICAQLDIEHALGTDMEVVEGRYTGRTQGILTYREGKIAALQQWRARCGVPAGDSHFYSDSQNDLPLLCAVEHPHAVNPDPTLRAHAEAQGWDILDWR